MTHPTNVDDIWPEDAPILFASTYGWSPETWGMVSFPHDSSLRKLLDKLDDPFVCVEYITGNSGEKYLSGKIVGFSLVAKEIGHRNELTHPICHDAKPGLFQYGFRRIRAFRFHSDFLLKANEVFRNLGDIGRTIGTHGVIVSDRKKLRKMRKIPYIEVPVYSSSKNTEPLHEELPILNHMVPAGPVNSGGYAVPERAPKISWKNYILRLNGGTGAYLKRRKEASFIYKIGISVDPDMRRDFFQKSMPKGRFEWEIYKTSKNENKRLDFYKARAGEDAMKSYLSENANKNKDVEWLGGEFYLASEKRINKAWKIGCASSLNFRKRSTRSN